MANVLFSAQSAFVVLMLMFRLSGLSIARPAQSSSVQGTKERLAILTAIKLTRKSYDLDICNTGLSLYLSRKRINKKNCRFTLMDARMLVPLLHEEEIAARMYVWCRTAELYHSLSQGQRKSFDVSSLDKFQGDIILKRTDVDLILGPFFPSRDLRIEAFDAARKFWTQGSARRVKRKLVPFRTQHWPNAIVHYKITRADFTPITLDTIAEAIAMWEKDTCIRFVESNKRFFQPHVNFRKGSGCSSAIGVSPHGQFISIGDGCESIGIISHEIGHALGFYHEQSRPDRDRYVDIAKDNIRSDPLQFAKIDWDAGMTLGIPYDYASVMHYRSTQLSIDAFKPVLVAKDTDMQQVMGQREGPSFLDVKLANRNYCSRSCSSTTLEWDECKNGGYRNPNDCNSCVCPRGLAPPRCEAPSKGINADCGQQILMATQSEQILTSPGYNKISGFNPEAFCPWMIKASTPGKRVRLQFTGKFYFTEDPVVCEDYAEVRYKDISRPGPRFCAETVPERVFRSHGSEMLVFAHSLFVHWWQGFQAIYAEENCGRCSADASNDEPTCLKTVKYDCSPENVCVHKGCPPGPSIETEVCGSGLCPTGPVMRSYTCEKTLENCDMGWFIRVKKNCKKTAICTVMEDSPACCRGNPVLGRCI
ncbi:zinc metalloproteinase nas-36-like [Liolophura sinensis]|uniref:zinc metalloproteinase nas-36-like n=1 Tax=Liolophura sinensis TaxID=3198878 RepID=UPI0031580AEC